MSGITVLSPVGINRVEARAVAARIPSLQGVRLGLLNNNKPNSARLLEDVSSLIGGGHALGGVVAKQKPNASVGAEGLDAYASEVQAVITAIGD